MMFVMNPKKLHGRRLPAIVPEQILPNFLFIYVLDLCGVRVCVCVFTHTFVLRIKSEP